MCTIIRTFCILSPQMKKAAHRAVPYQNRSSLARQRNLLFIALFCLLFQRYASALLLSTALRKFIKATKNGFFFCIKNRPGFLLRKPGRSYTLFVLSQALTQNLAGGLDSSLGGCQNCRAFGNHSSPFGYPHYNSSFDFISIQLSASVPKSCFSHHPSDRPHSAFS